MTLATTVRAAAKRFGDRIAFVDPDGTRLTYADLDRRSDEVAVGLLDRGVHPGAVVLLRLPSTSYYVVAYAAAAKLGAITAGTNPRLARREQQAVAELADPAVIIGEPDDVLGLRCAGEVPPVLPADPDRPVSLVFTSGTTGTPKGALFRERELAAVTRIDVGEAVGDPKQSPMHTLAGTQFAHVGFMTKLPWYLRLGTTTHVLARWTAGDALDLIERHRMTSVGGVAPQIALMLRDPRFDERDLSAVQTIVVGGAMSPPAMVREARKRFGAAYSIRYSSTESGGCGTGTAFDADDEEALFTVGRPRGGIAIEVRDTDGSELPAGEVGEVWMRSPTTMAEYWRNPEETARTLVDGWLRTGDLGTIDERGLLRMAGRGVEMYIRGGYNVYPAEVEAQISDHPLVAEVAVVARPDDVMGEVGEAVVVPADATHPPALEDLRTFLRDRLASYKHPEALRLVDVLPRTPGDKVDRRALTSTD